MQDIRVRSRPNIPTVPRAQHSHPDKVSAIHLQGANPAWIGPFELLSEEELRWWRESMFGARASFASCLYFQKIIEKNKEMRWSWSPKSWMCVTPCSSWNAPCSTCTGRRHKVVLFLLNEFPARAVLRFTTVGCCCWAYQQEYSPTKCPFVFRAAFALGRFMFSEVPPEFAGTERSFEICPRAARSLCEKNTAVVKEPTKCACLQNNTIE